MYIPTNEPEFADHHSLVIDLFDFLFSHLLFTSITPKG